MPTIISGTEGITTKAVREGVFALAGASVALDHSNGVTYQTSNVAGSINYWAELR